MKKLRGTLRLIFFALAVVWLVAKITWFNLRNGPDMQRAIRLRKQWLRRFLPMLGVRLQVRGQAPVSPCIVLCNHRSYLDPPVLLCDVPGLPISKSEVANWPLVGYGVKVTGTLFLHRESAKSRRETLLGIAEAVAEGHIIILFPEGTTHANATTSTFKRGTFQLAAQYGISVVPAALEYGSAEDYWIGDDTFVPHFLARFGEKNMRVSVRYGEAMQSADADWLLRETQTWIDRQIAEMRRENF